MLAAFLMDSVSFRDTLAAQLPKVTVDRDRLMQVVINLLGKRDASIAVAVSLAALLLATALLFLLSFVDPSGRRRGRAVDQ
jgi:nitrogen-specific signal transduction histidine kinase